MPLPAQDAPPEKLALLIGVGQYAPDSGIRQLRGPPNDVARMRTLLEERFEFEPDNVRELLNEKATLEAIVRAFDEYLLRSAGKDTEVFVYFAGHGSVVPDPTGVEAKVNGVSSDQSWLAYDSRAEKRKGSFDLTDDALFSLLRPLTAEKGARVTVVTDACHSGGSLRGSATERRVGKGTEPVEGPKPWSFWPEKVRWYDDIGAPKLTRYVHLSACANDQTAYEDYEETAHGRDKFGVFTLCLIDALLHVDPDATYRDVASETASRLRNHTLGINQSPWFDGPDLGRSWFGAAFEPPPRGHPVLRVPSSSRLVVRGGRLHGIVPGAKLEVRLLSGQSVGQAEVREAGYADAMARWSDGVRDRVPKKGALVGEIASLPEDLPRLRVHVPKARVAKLLANNAWATIEEDEARADYFVDVGEDVRILTRERTPLPMVRKPDYVVEVATGFETDKELAFKLTRAFREEAQFRGLWELARGPAMGDIGDLEAKWVAPNKNDLRRRHQRTYVAATLVPHATRDGLCARLPMFDEQEKAKTRQLAILEVSAPPGRELNLAVFSLSENRDLSLLCQTERGRPWDTSESKRVETWIGAPGAERWPLQRTSLDRYVVVVTDEYVPFSQFAENRSSATRAGGDRLPGILQSICRSGVTRSGGRMDKPMSGFGVVAVDLWIERAR